MLRFDSDSGTARGHSGGPFVLYIEGPRDRAILRAWSYRLLPARARDLFRASVILGGRRPDRAIEHFRRLGGGAGGARAVCVLDRDDVAEAEPAGGRESGLSFFTWSRRHIESYLLVPGAIRRAVRAPDDRRRLDRLLREHLPPEGDEGRIRDVDAKRLLGPMGVLARALGRSLPLGGIAQATREVELHDDVHALFALLRAGIGADAPRPVVCVTSRISDTP